MPRLFIAIYPLPFQNEISKIQKELSKFIIGKFVEVKNIHITLSFLGNVERKEIKKIEKNLKKISSSFKPFEILINGMELIPSENFFRVVALKILSSDIYKLSSAIEKLIGGDIKPPHLTLARVKKVINKNEIKKFAKDFTFNKTFVVDSIKLMESTLTRNGPIYNIIESFDFTQEYR